MATSDEVSDLYTLEGRFGKNLAVGPLGLWYPRGRRKHLDKGNIPGAGEQLASENVVQTRIRDRWCSVDNNGVISRLFVEIRVAT
jgi:hypothetical protein